MDQSVANLKECNCPNKDQQPFMWSEPPELQLVEPFELVPLVVRWAPKVKLSAT